MCRKPPDIWVPGAFFIMSFASEIKKFMIVFFIPTFAVILIRLIEIKNINLY